MGRYGRLELPMMRNVQLSVADAKYAAAVREALCRSCAWHVSSPTCPIHPSRVSWFWMTWRSLCLFLPLKSEAICPDFTRQRPCCLTHAWDAGVLSVVSPDDPMSTVLLAIMAAWLCECKRNSKSNPSGISPNSALAPAPIAPQKRNSSTKRCKIQ